MTLSRRGLLHLATGAVAVSVGSRIALAQTYPTRPVHLLEAFGAGGSPDIIARLMAQWLWERFGQPFVVENRSGANGSFAAEAAARASPDGYTLLLAVSPHVIDASFHEKLNFDFMRDLAPIASISRVPLVMAVNPSVPADTVPEFIAYAMANPGKMNMASVGIGNITHVSGELFMMLTGVKLFHVPYHGGAQVLSDLISGQVQVMFGPLTAAVEQIKAGRLRALAVTSATRSPVLPDVPTVGDYVPGYEVSGWYGVVAPRNTPAEIIDKLNEAINAGLTDPKIMTRLFDLGNTVFAGSPADFAKFIADETEKWAKVIKLAGIKTN
jgi:tripartite-type tricarboxylate transporter receptor subunit TctC